MAPKSPASRPRDKPQPRPTFFETPAVFRKWLEANHETAAELLVGYYKKDTGRPSITWPESVDQALCFGWIDGIRRSLSSEAYTIRFTPRRQTSTWSEVNTRRMKELIAAGLVKPAGLAAFEARKAHRSGIYASEQRDEALPEQYARVFRRNQPAWDFFQSLRPSYRKVMTWWVVSAKQEETRLRRLERLIAESARGRTFGSFTPVKQK